MFALDFLFDGTCASDLGLMICSFNGEPEAASGGEIEYIVSKTPGRDRFSFYGSQLNSVIEWHFSICKNPCAHENMYFNRYEESNVIKWLIKMDGYKPFQLKQPGYEDIFYNVYFNVTPHQIAGQTVGFDLTATSDCAYGFTDVKKREGTLISSTPLKLNIHSDINTYILPYIKLKASGNFHIWNHKPVTLNNTEHSYIKNAGSRNTSIGLQNISTTTFTGITNKLTITMDSDTDTIFGLTDPQNFDWHFLRLVDGLNIITTDSDSGIEIEIWYREPRFVRV